MARRASRSSRKDGSNSEKGPNNFQHARSGSFADIAMRISQLAGRPVTFVIAVTLIILWAVSGPLFGFSDTWQLVVNTSTTIITFLMVFLIQNTQNRDTAAVQVKLDALIFATRGAQNKLAAAEDMSDEELEQLHSNYRSRAEQTSQTLQKRQKTRTKTKH